MGSCEADYCYTSKRPMEIPGVFQITKGCVKKPSRSQAGCDYDSLPDHILCVCAGKFCNDGIVMRHTFRRNVTCRKCSEKEPNCSKTCSGHWCHEDSITGISGCGFGPPSLPYFYKGPQLLSHRSRVCVTMAWGSSMKARKHCICSTNMCNDFMRAYQMIQSAANNPAIHHKPRVHNGRSLYDTLPIYQCVLCDVTSHDAKMTSSCKQNRCMGNFCTYGMHRTNGQEMPSIGISTQRITERQV
uniref:Activin_recp domain-containing protein n=1 Tax=Rhabditophanes sp. KR3021 TaxID=114890 RepID=A0AC35TNA9_9BILA